MTTNPRKRRGFGYSGMDADMILGVYPSNYYDCRVGRHNFPTKNNKKSGDSVVWQYVAPRRLDRTSACRSCGLAKTEHLDNHFRRVEAPTYHYPPGYLTPKSGLVKEDFVGVVYADDFAKANAEDRVHGIELDAVDEAMQQHPSSNDIEEN